MSKRWINPSFENADVINKKVKFDDESKRAKNVNKWRNESASTVTWVDKYKPRDVKDLVIHPKKLEEVKSWFNKYKRRPYSCKYLLVSGPSGCGKMSSINAIAKANNVKIIEWITPLDRDHYDGQEYRAPVAQIFKSFLLQATRYPTLFGEQSLKIILVKDFPNIFLHNPSTFHEIVVNFYDVKSHPVIFICNDENVIRKLFPVDIKEKCRVEIINFNPIHCKAVITALKRIIANENVADRINIQPLELDRIYRQTEGDLRAAVLKLYFKFVNLNGNITTRNDTSEQERVCIMKGEDKNKDNDCNLFVGLGRVLYSKRNPTTTTNGKNKDYKFVHDPSIISGIFLPEAGNFINFLQENYLSRFSDMNAIAIAAETFSFVDNISTLRDVNEETDSLMLEITCRTLMTVNSNPVKQFKSFVKPSSYNIKSRREILNEKRLLFPQLQYDFSSDVILHVLPFLKNISSELHSEEANF